MMKVKTFSTLNPPDEHYPLLQTIYTILTSYIWIIPVVFGVPGNILSILVANRPHNRKLSPCIYMKAMAVADTLFLLEVIWFQAIFSTGSLDSITTKSTRREILSFHIFMMWTCGGISGLFLAAMSVDRLIAVRFPLAASRLCTTKRAKVSVVAVTLPSIAMNAPILFVKREYVEEIASGIRIILIKEPAEIDNAISLSTTLVGAGVPFMVIFVCNLVIIFTLKKEAHVRDNLESSMKRKKSQHQLTFMLIFVSLAFIVTSLPYRLDGVVMDIDAINTMHDMTQHYWRLRRGIGLYVLVNLWFYNYAVNFYLYCIGGGQRYRNDIRELMASFYKSLSWKLCS